MSPSCSWWAGPVYFSISHCGNHFKAAYAISHSSEPEQVPLCSQSSPYVEPKEPEKTTALIATAVKKKAFRARSGVSGMHRVWTGVSSCCVTVSSAWTGLCPSLRLWQTCTFTAAWKWKALCRLHYRDPGSSSTSWPVADGKSGCMHFRCGILGVNSWLQGRWFLFFQTNCWHKNEGK